MRFIDHILIKNKVVLRVKENIDPEEAIQFAIQFCGQFKTSGFLYIGKTGIPVHENARVDILKEAYNAFSQSSKSSGQQ